MLLVLLRYAQAYLEASWTCIVILHSGLSRGVLGRNRAGKMKSTARYEKDHMPSVHLTGSFRGKVWG